MHYEALNMPESSRGKKKSDVRESFIPDVPSGDLNLPSRMEKEILESSNEQISAIRMKPKKVERTDSKKKKMAV